MLLGLCDLVTSGAPSRARYDDGRKRCRVWKSLIWQGKETGSAHAWALIGTVLVLATGRVELDGFGAKGIEQWRARFRGELRPLSILLYLLIVPLLIKLCMKSNNMRLATEDGGAREDGGWRGKNTPEGRGAVILLSGLLALLRTGIQPDKVAAPVPSSVLYY